MKENNFPRMHVSLYVTDIEKTVSFYSAFFGAEPTKVKEGYAKFTLDKPSLIISFVQNKYKVSPNVGHFGFQVETQQELTDKLVLAKLNDLSVIEENNTACCYAVQDKFWVSDPDGYMWETYYFHADVEFNNPRTFQTKELEGACCTTEAEKIAADCCTDTIGEKKKVNLNELTKTCC